ISHRLVWYAGNRRLGTGGSLIAMHLPLGKSRITLVARDRHGRTASASVPVEVRVTPPILLFVKTRARLGRRAQRLKLRIATVSSARLTVTGHGLRRVVTSVGPKAKTLVLRVPRGHRALRLRLTLRAGGSSSTIKLRIARH